MEGIEWDSEGDYKVHIGEMKREKEELFLVRKEEGVWKGKERNYIEKQLTSQREGHPEGKGTQIMEIFRKGDERYLENNMMPSPA